MTRPGAGGRIGRVLLDGARRLRADARGVTAIEYAMIAGLIFAVLAGSLRLYGTKMNTVYDRIGTEISAQIQ
ncbi:Flp family type IVb pilin [Methylobacterium nigriterrae]|uniref:Flp family type IVb pilin n=1 Tax=Methylobacterium nigriterrae TaxID=3127512 RepID=UPI00301368FD